MATKNQCKYCLAECQNGEQHICWLCFCVVENRVGAAGVVHTKGSCFLCRGSTPAELLCRPCFDAACLTHLAVDTSGPPVPFVPSYQAPPNVSYGGLAKQVYAGIPAPLATPPLLDPFSFEWDDARPTPPSPRPREKPTCRSCGRGLSEYLDAYWGKDSCGSAVCAPCRGRLGIQ